MLLADQKASTAKKAPMARTASVPQAKPAPKPLAPGDLTDLLLSPSARQEVAAAKALRSGAVRAVVGESRGRPGREEDVDVAQLDLDVLDGPAPTGGFDIEFDGDDIDIPEGPRPMNMERARFRVDRPPVRAAYEPRTMPDAYEVVASRTAAREQAQQGPVVVRQVRAPAPYQPPAVSTPSRTTAYDHLDRGGGDDDPFS